MNKSLDSGFDITEDDLDDEEDLNLEDEDSEDQKAATPDKDADDDIVVEVEDDTPEEDKGKWVASDDDDDPEPEEDEVKQYSESVQKRIKKATARIHAERRRADQKEREAQEAAHTAKALLAELNRHKDMIEVGEKALVQEHKGNLDASLKAAQIKYREAKEADDDDAMVGAMEEIARLAAKQTQVEGRQFTPLPRHSEEELFPQRQPDQPAADDRAKDWQKKNKWFMRDQVMTATAMGIHTDLTNNKGIMPDDDRYYDAIDSEMRKRFPEHFGKPKQGARRRSNVAGAKRGDANTRRRITLTESQQRIAKRMGITNEQYAAAMVEVDKEQRNG